MVMFYWLFREVRPSHTWFGLATRTGVKDNRADDITATELQIDCHNNYIERLITRLSNAKIVVLVCPCSSNVAMTDYSFQLGVLITVYTHACDCISKLLL